MKELEQIKKVENEVSRNIEIARSNAEKKISGMSRDKDKIVGERLESLKLKLDRNLEKNRAAAEADAANILKASDTTLREVQKSGEKNFQKAVKMILGFFSYNVIK